jgi:hypothetical protein
MKILARVIFSLLFAVFILLFPIMVFAIDQSPVVYSLVLRNRTPVINPGDSLGIEIFLSGYGVPKKNKLDVKFSSPYVVNIKNPGTLTAGISVLLNATTGEIIRPITDLPKTYKLDEVGADVTLNYGFFLSMPDTKFNSNEVDQIVSETEWNGSAPILLTINTSNDAPSGDYDVIFTFTYGDEQLLSQDQKVAHFRITSWWERNEWWITIIGVILAFIAVAPSLINTWKRVIALISPRPKNKPHSK